MHTTGLLFISTILLYSVYGLDLGLYYTTSKDGPERQCIKCPPGSYVRKDCLVGEVNSTDCQVCPVDRYSAVWNAYLKCKPCKRDCYGLNEVLVVDCKPNHDIICGCPDGYWHKQHGTPDAKCLRHKQCGKGFGVDKPGTNLSDSTCIDCVWGSNFSSIISSSAPCQPCRDCQKEGWKETSPCTVFKNSECDVKTSSTSSTTQVTTTSSTNTATPATTTTERRHSTDQPSTTVVYVIVALVCITIVIILFVVAYFVYKWYKERENAPSDPDRCRKNSYSNETFLDTVQVDTMSTISEASYVSENVRDVRRRISTITLKEHITLEQDVFPWLASKLGKRYPNICKSLPGNRITQQDIEAAEYEQRTLHEVIVQILETWKQKNGNNDAELFRDIYSTLLYVKKDDLAWKLRNAFAF